LAFRAEIRHYLAVFQLILPFQLDLPFEAEAGAGARPGGAASASSPRAVRARRPRREVSRSNLAFEFTLAHMSLDEE
jgi:hypothetical protein